MGLTNISNEEFKIFDDYNTLMVSLAKKDEKKLARRLSVAKKILTRKRFKALEAEISESFHAYDFKFVKSVDWRSKEETSCLMPRVKIFMHQHSTCEGDGCKGKVAFPIKDGYWLEWSFEF